MGVETYLRLLHPFTNFDEVNQLYANRLLKYAYPLQQSKWAICL